MLLTLLLLAGCPDPARDKAAAVITDVPPSAPTGAPAAAASAQPDAPWSSATGSIGFHAAKVTRSHDAVFGQQSFSVQFASGVLAGVRAEVQIASLKTDTPKLDAHLQSADFFDAANLPRATFESTAIRPGAPAGTALVGASHTVEGDLTIHGITRHIQIPAVIETSAAGVSARTEFSIQRQDFGIVYPGKADDLIADGVLIRAEFQATPPG